MQFVIFHSSFNKSSQNWFPALSEKLQSAGQEVFVPQFPIEQWNEITNNGPDALPKNQSLESWFSTFESFLPRLADKKLCFIGHSLGCLFILHAVAKFNLTLDSAIFASPFLDWLHQSWQIDRVNASFYKTDFDFENLKKLIPVSYTLYSDNDPYVDEKFSFDFSLRIASKPLKIEGAGHFNSEGSYNPLPLLFDLCKLRFT